MIIALTGKKRCGKTTATNYLKERYGAVSINFKDALIEELRNGFPDLLAEISLISGLSTGELFERKPPLIRKLLQNFGTDVRRAEDPERWARIWKERALQESTLVVTDDVRFRNEAQAVKDLRGIIIRLIRPDLESTDHHLSETEMDSIEADYTISAGQGDFDKLFYSLDIIVREYGTNN